MSSPSRRHVLGVGGAIACAGALGGCGAAGGEDLPTGADGSIRVPLSDTPVGSSTYYSGPVVIVTRVGEAEVIAFDATCPHQGCQVSITRDDGTLVCPCHNSTFAGDSGAVRSGPATAGLTTLPAEIDGEDVVVRG